MLDFGMMRSVLFLTLLLTLVGCSDYIKSTPYMAGSFVGYYLTEPNATPLGLRLETTIGEVTTTRYTFTGTATLGTESYAVEGYETAYSNLGYITSQALPPPSGDLVVMFKDSSGTVAYSLCSTVGYSSDSIDTRYTFNGAALYTGECGPGSTISDENVFAEVFLEKQRL